MQITCRGCGLTLSSTSAPTDPKVNASGECRALCYDLSFYTLQRGDVFFIHQVLVDAYGAQHYKDGAPKVGLAFALIGLCLLLEYDYTGKDVQDAHIRLAKLKKEWPSFAIPERRGTHTVADPLAVPAGKDRDRAIIDWARTVWEAYEPVQDQVRTLLHSLKEI